MDIKLRLSLLRFNEMLHLNLELHLLPDTRCKPASDKRDLSDNVHMRVRIKERALL